MSDGCPIPEMISAKMPMLFQLENLDFSHGSDEVVVQCCPCRVCLPRVPKPGVIGLRFVLREQNLWRCFPKTIDLSERCPVCNQSIAHSTGPSAFISICAFRCSKNMQGGVVRAKRNFESKTVWCISYANTSADRMGFYFLRDDL